MKTSTLSTILRVLGGITAIGCTVYAIYVLASIPLDLISTNLVILILTVVLSGAILCTIMLALARILVNTTERNSSPTVSPSTPKGRITTETFYVSSENANNGNLGEIEGFLNLIGAQNTIQIVACPETKIEDGIEKRLFLVVYSMPIDME